MENAADALKMAAAIIIFIIAIASSFSLFGIAKETADAIITMRDKQAYLKSADLDTVLYTSSDKIQSESGVEGFTKEGYRIVTIADVFSTIYRYSIESYGVTIIQVENTKGKVIARYDTGTETFISTNWNKMSADDKDVYINELRKNLKNIYIDSKEIEINFEEIYKLENGKVIAPWLGSLEKIKARINADIKDLTKLKEKKIVEVTNEIDKSTYLEDNGEPTDLVEQYSMPSVEIIYLVY